MKSTSLGLFNNTGRESLKANLYIITVVGTTLFLKKSSNVSAYLL